MYATQFDILAAGAAALRRYARLRFKAEEEQGLSVSWPDAAAIVEVAQVIERKIAGGTVAGPMRLTREQQGVLRSVRWTQTRLGHPDGDALGALVTAISDRTRSDASSISEVTMFECDDDEAWRSGRFAARGHPLRHLRVGEADWIVHERTIRDKQVLVFETWGVMRVVRQVPRDWRSLPDFELIGVSERR